VRAERASRGLTQSGLAKAAGVAIDSVRRIEGANYPLPTRPRSSGHALDRLLNTLGYEVSAVIHDCFSRAEIAPSVYAQLPRTPKQSKKSQRVATESLSEYVASLPKTRQELLREAGMLNARAMAFLVALERIFDKFEFLVTNQPPFVLFADDEYVTRGSSSTELAAHDRQTYHDFIFRHRDTMRRKVTSGEKHYRIVLDKGPLIAFLAARTRERAQLIISDMHEFLRYECFDLVVVENPEPTDEFEVLAGHFPYTPLAQGDAVSIRHRRIGVGNTALYQLSLIGLNDEMVQEDYRRADQMWTRGVKECEDQPEDYGEYQRNRYTLKRKRIVARILQDAMETAHR
jgi:transcriptional regulator with XRE-family HTH domain